MFRSMIVCGILPLLTLPTCAAAAPEGDCPFEQFVNDASREFQHAADVVGQHAAVTSDTITRTAQRTGREIARQVQNVGETFQHAAVRIWAAASGGDQR